MEHHAKNHDMVKGEHSPKEVVKFIAVIAAIFGFSLLLNATEQASFENWMRLFMGTFFMVFGAFKLIGYRMFTEMFAGYDIVARKSKAYAYVYPFIELVLAVMYLGDLLPGFREIITVVILGAGSIGVAQELRRRRGFHCACLGNVIKLPLSTVSFVEDAGMGIMALVMLVIMAL